MDLVRRAIELRAPTRGDISLDGFEDDGAYIHLDYTFTVPDGRTLRDAYDRVLRLQRELEEAAEHAGDDVGRFLSDTAQRISGWGTQPLDALVNAVETSKSTDDKGRSLECLFVKLEQSMAKRFNDPLIDGLEDLNDYWKAERDADAGGYVDPLGTPSQVAAQGSATWQLWEKDARASRTGNLGENRSRARPTDLVRRGFPRLPQ